VVVVGDRILAGEIDLEITFPGITCGMLVARMQDSDFRRCCRESGRPGVRGQPVYLNCGSLQRGNRATCLPGPSPQASVLVPFDLAVDAEPDLAVIGQ
jgi:MOSC domain-containing protein YiiM